MNIMYSLFSYKEFMTPSKGWKLEALSDQFLNRHIDNVGQIVAGPRGLQAGLDDYLPGSLTVRCDVEKFTDHLCWRRRGQALELI